ncbi:hypothetical protein Acr_07g0006680 [Actinidia rufa]|uniref:Uncharacterized protein n=1 Tax=Actinidia rufa TaxID=165716 RepID=A0A7J0EVH3_9ERIC|nr:hypothetical protein Acr_07g0006680 [Actinidia rufa]
MELRQVISTELARATLGVLISSPRARVLSPPRPRARGFERPHPGPLLLFVYAGRPLSLRGPVPRRPSNIDCWLLAQISTTTISMPEFGGKAAVAVSNFFYDLIASKLL